MKRFAVLTSLLVGLSAVPASAVEVHQKVQAYTTGTFIEELDQAGNCKSLVDFDLKYRYTRRIVNGVVKIDTPVLTWTIVYADCQGNPVKQDGNTSNEKVPFTPKRVNLNLTGTLGTYHYTFKPTDGMPVSHSEFIQWNVGGWQKKHTRMTHWWTNGNTELSTPLLPTLKGEGGYDAFSRGVNGHVYPVR